MSVVYLLSRGASAREVDGRLRVEKDGHVIQSLPMQDVESLIFNRSTRVSTSLFFTLLDQQTGIFLVDGRGCVKGQISGRSISWERSRCQWEIFTQPEARADLIRTVLREKLTQEMKLLRYYAKERSRAELTALADEIKAYRSHLTSENDPSVLRGIEGISARRYFDGFPMILDPSRWPWNGRNRRPPRDPVNALLSYGYAFLEREVRLGVLGAGLDARIGFLHSNNGRKDSLIFDLMELFRQLIVDRLVLKLLNRGQFRPDDFMLSDEEGCRLTLQARKAWIRYYETFMSREYQEYGGRTPRDWLRQRIQVFATELYRQARDRQ